MINLGAILVLKVVKRLAMVYSVVTVGRAV